MARFLVPLRSKIVRWRGALEGLLPEDHLARFIWRTLMAIDFSDLEATYRSTEAGPGRSPFHPRALAALWTYGMTRGMEEATAIAEACLLRDDFRWLAGGLCPSDQTLLNLLTRAQGRLASIWEQLLRAMHDAGHVDLSAVAEDGTKLHANASHSSFHNADEIAVIIKQLRGEFEERIARANARPEGEVDTNADAALVGLGRRLARAERAAAELREREQRRSRGSLDNSPPLPNATLAALPGSPPPSAAATATPPGSTPPRFHRADFRHDAERDVMVCPAQEDLHLIGVYPTENGKGRYRLYGRSDCRGCAIKTRCTNAQGRRLKVSTEMEQPTTVPIGTSVTPPIVPSPLNASAVTPPIADATASTISTPTAAGPQASITEPEALMMLATSQKRWEPSYNADITCGGCLLKARCTEAKGRRVKIVVGDPASGQDAAGLADSAGLAESTTNLPSDLAETSGPALDVLIREHEARMNDIGPNVMRFRGQTVEPVNSQLKQHGLGRLHVHGLARCGVVLALACMAHNLMKWNTREVARAMKKAA